MLMNWPAVLLSLGTVLVPSAFGQELLPHTLTGLDQISAALASVKTRDGFLGVLKAIKPASSPSTPEDALNAIEGALNASSSGSQSSNKPLLYSALLRQKGLVDSVDQLVDLNGIQGCVEECSFVNVNSRRPVRSIYPQASPEDAPYSVGENDLRAAIYIPPGFKYGEVFPLILVPGTGNVAGQTYRGNLGVLFKDSHIADVVYLNIPNYLLGDAQVSAEYVAYAISYVSGISSRPEVAVATWSQGSINAQWALKYWPSTRKLVTDIVQASGDYDGTIIANALCTLPICSKSVLQQQHSSNFIRTLLNGGGSSAYVPTTSVYSATDQIVEPQQDPFASAFIEDERKVGVLNAEVQTVCLLKPAGSVYPHELVLVNPLYYALVVDALTHDGPASLDRIDLDTVCSQIFAPGLSIEDVILTEDTGPIATTNIFFGPEKALQEPEIMAYAKKDEPLS